jgi:carbonic anhydrase
VAAGPSKPAPAAPAPAAHAEDTFSLTPAQSFAQLLEGNRRFRTGASEHEGIESRTREELAGGQSPHAIVLTCSDSRVPPEQVFDQGLGDLFVIRGAGNTVTEEELASMEYAVEHLGSKLIVVMGHESCGAVKTALETPAGKSAGSANLDKLMDGVRRGIESEELTPTDKADPKARKAVEANVHSVVRELSEKSPILREKLASGEVAAVPAVYSLDSGEVSFEPAA